MSVSDRFVLPGRVKPYVMAHRGNRVACPENTLASFKRALADGADILETDLHLTADGVLACIHDATVDRTTNGHGAVAEISLEKLKKLSASYGRPEFMDERVPTLAELLSILPKETALGLELKTDRFLEPEIGRQLASELEAGSARDRTILLSFSLPRLNAVQHEAPDIPTGFITLSQIVPTRGTQLIGPFWPIMFLNPFYSVMAHRQDQLVCPLDPNPDGRLWYYRWMRCDAVLTDNPEATCRALKRK